MGSYLGSATFLELPLEINKDDFGIQEILFGKKNKYKKIVNRIIESNYSRIQTVYKPTEEEMIILNEVFKRNSNIIFRYYLGFEEDPVDISFLVKLNNMKSLSLEVYHKIKNIEILQQLNLNSLCISCFNVKDYSFLKGVSSSIKDLTIDLEDKTYKMDINDILHMKDLEVLSLRNVKKGLDKLTEFRNLKELYLRSVIIKDYSFLKQMNVNKIYLSFQKVEYFNTFGENEKIEEVSLWMNRNLTDLSFLLQFPNLKRIIISAQSKVKVIPDLTRLKKLEEIYFLDRDIKEISQYCNSNVKVYSRYNPVDIN